MIRQIIFFVACFCSIAAPQAYAHRPYERPLGVFHRSDGENIKIVKHFIDGILAADPSAIRFHLSDGTTIAASNYHTEVIIHRTTGSVEIFEFNSSWLPLASHIRQFDGYSLKDATTWTKRLVSPFVHIFDHLASYLVSLVIGTFLLIRWKAGQASKISGFSKLFVGGGTALYLLFILWISPLSPVILYVLASLCIVLWPPIRKFAGTGSWN